MFFYKLIIEILDRLAERLLQSEDIVGILSPLKPYQNNQKDWKLFVRSLQKNKEKINWQRLAYHAEQRVIDEATIITILNEAYNRSTHDETGEMYFNKPL